MTEHIMRRIDQLEEKLDNYMQSITRDIMEIKEQLAKQSGAYRVALEKIESVEKVNDNRWSMTKVLMAGIVIPLVGTLLLLIYEVVTG